MLFQYRDPSIRNNLLKFSQVKEKLANNPSKKKKKKKKLANKTTRQKEELLSKAGKEILINVVAQENMIYTMSCFKLPNALFDDFNQYGKKFLGGSKDK